MLLPPAFQDKTEFLPLGKATKKPEPAKADPVAAFERVRHDTDGPAPWDHIANRRAWAELNVEYDAEMAKARARLVEPAALKAGDVVTMACFPGKTYTIAELAETGSGAGSFRVTRDGLDANPARKLDWPKLDT